MFRTTRISSIAAILLMLVPVICFSGSDSATDQEKVTYTELVSLFHKFREFQFPILVDNVPDYSPAAMTEKHRGLEEFQSRLAALDVREWPIAQQVDFHLVRAEMNGLDFQLRVQKPWQRDPVFYLFSQDGAGPVAFGRPIIGQMPLSSDGLATLDERLRAVPRLLHQARKNLTEASGDLTIIALYFLKDEIQLYEELGEQLRDSYPQLLPAVAAALEAVRAYGVWLDDNKASMTAPAGLGKENFNWYLRNVQMVPFTWDELWISLKLEYEQTVAALKIEENRNRNAPPLRRVASNDEYHQRWKEAERNIYSFVQENEIFTIPDYVEPYDPGTWWGTPERGHALDFFEQCRDRDMLAEVCHNYLGHNLDELRSARDDRPIRGEVRLFVIDMIRSEGVAYGLEELLRLAGMYDKHPRGREIHFTMKTFRVARGLADLKLHNNELDLVEAIDFCYERTPNGWMLRDGFEAWYEMQTALRFPGWHMGFNLGKNQLLKLISDVARVRGDDFVLRDALDEFFAAGMVPFSLTRWEMTGLTDEIEALW